MKENSVLKFETFVSLLTYPINSKAEHVPFHFDILLLPPNSSIPCNSFFVTLLHVSLGLHFLLLPIYLYGISSVQYDTHMLYHMKQFSVSKTPLLPPTYEIRVRFPAKPQVGKLVLACRWFTVYSTEP